MCPSYRVVRQERVDCICFLHSSKDDFTYVTRVCQMEHSCYFTSFSYSFIIISVRVRNEILRPGLFGAVVQLTHVLGNDVVEALTSNVNTAGLNTFGRV